MLYPYAFAHPYEYMFMVSAGVGCVIVDDQGLTNLCGYPTATLLGLGLRKLCTSWCVMACIRANADN